MSGLLNKATERSLVIIDEFGKGSLVSDGVGLMCALLHHLAHGQPAPPKVLATTHFHEVFNTQLLPR